VLQLQVLTVVRGPSYQTTRYHISTRQSLRLLPREPYFLKGYILL